jgi:Protein of unknown function (DUF2911)
MRCKVLSNVFLALAATALIASGSYAARHAQQRDKSQRPSPPDHAACKFANGVTVTLDYSSPRMKGRKIYGELVPYGQVWRAGANEATTFVVSGPVRAGSSKGGLDIPAGSYTLFVIPNKEKPWTLIISKKTGEWGIPYPGEQLDLGRADMGIDALPAPLEDFTINLAQESGDVYQLQIDWETTRAHVQITPRS